MILQYYLQHHPHPELIVLCFHVEDLGSFGNTLNKYASNGWQQTLAKYATEDGAKEYINSRSLYQNVALGMRVFVGTISGRPALDMDEPIPALHGATYSSVRTFFRDNRGFWLLCGTMQQTSGVQKPSDIVLCPEYKESVAQLISQVGQYGIPVFVCITPSVTGTTVQGSAELPAWLEELMESRDAKVFVGQSEVIEYGPECFTDPFHTNCAGAEKFTTFLAEEVTRIMAGKSVSRRE